MPNVAGLDINHATKASSVGYCAILYRFLEVVRWIDMGYSQPLIMIGALYIVSIRGLLKE